MSDHVPVLEKEVIGAFMEQPRNPLRLFEGTFGRGGHTRSLLKQFPRAKVVSFDRDEDAIAHARENFAGEMASGRLQLIKDDFRNLSHHELGLFDGALLDLGVSSPQLDVGERGFSFMHEGPLDMRMDRSQTLTAATLINEMQEKDLIDLFRRWGEVPKPQRVVRAIVHDRAETPFTSTRQLASLIERVERAGRRRFGSGKGGHKGRAHRGSHPATNYFLALRIAVNRELEGLGEFFESLHLQMEPGSRLVVITFHSLEDRIAKVAFKKMHKKYGKIINKKVIVASDGEVEANPRARSAKMRIFEWGGPL